MNILTSKNKPYSIGSRHRARKKFVAAKKLLDKGKTNVELMAERLKESVTIDSNGCWLWQKSMFANGYGKIHINLKAKGAHVVSFETFNNKKIQKGLLCLHRCDVRQCINPEHLYEGTYKDNRIDCLERNTKTKVITVFRLRDKTYDLFTPANKQP